MVLLSSSTVSVVLSSGVVCLFTFLLFLSGYVLQQQTVRSLQEALQAPIDDRISFKGPILSQQLGAEVHPNSDNDSAFGAALPDVALSSQTATEGVQDSQGTQIWLNEDRNAQSTAESTHKDEPSPQELWRTHVNSLSLSMDTGKLTAVDLDPSQAATKQQLNSQSGSDPVASVQNLAYILPLPEPRSLCSAMLFTKWHREQSTLSTPPTIIFLYPSDWETSRTDAHLEAMELLRQSEEAYHILYHPVPLSKVWNGIDIESQLLSELARVPWSYHRVMYLRTPGMTLDTMKLDRILSSSDTKKSWSKLKSNSRSRKSQGPLHPDILMYQHGKGLLVPEGGLKKLTAKATIGRHADNHVGEIESETLSIEAAYIIFDELELEHRRKEKVAYSGLFERFEREREDVCAGTTLLGLS